MRILVVGSGGREHALAWKLKQSPEVEQIFCAPGNAGTASLGENVAIPVGDLTGLARFAKQNRIGLTVVGPDAPLAEGIADLFQSQSLRIFGPTKSAARIESSKIFAKTLMRNAGIPTAAAEVFTSSEEALRHCETVSYPVVIKADGLALGKGVVIAADRALARSTVDAMMNRARFGDAGRRVVIEQFLRGSECSLHVLFDGSSYQLLGTARDHKRAFDGDEGPNTGGMGAVSPASSWSERLEQRFDQEIMQPLMAALQEEKVEFHGLLFPGLMLTLEGPRVLEFNCRFGDPETQAILPRLKSDLLPLLHATIDGTIKTQQIIWDERPAVTVVLASGGYPDKYETGKPITGLADAGAIEDVQLFHAGTRQTGSVIATSGGRVLAVTALGDTMEAARARAYQAVSCIEFEGCYYRRDIALTSTIP
ncbi:MAG: phosphoribosylamine--glycine ligase [Chthoniobacterales bacterium]